MFFNRPENLRPACKKPEPPSAATGGGGGRGAPPALEKRGEGERKGTEKHKGQIYLGVKKKKKKKTPRGNTP